MHIKAFLRKLLNPFLHPSFGACYRCRRTWDVVDGHTTWDKKSESGSFPLCEGCWRELGTGEKRLPYYKKHQTDVNKQMILVGLSTELTLKATEKTKEIERAVLAGE